MRFLALCGSLAILSGCALLEPEQPLAKDHYLKLKSSAPGMAGGETSLYVRQIPAAANSPIPKADRAVLFVHGGVIAGATVFDLRPEYSWMRHFADAGYDTFAVEFTGYGRSTRPAAMNDPCNTAEAAQKQFIPVLIPAPCRHSIDQPIVTLDSEWEEMDAVIEYIRKVRGVDKVAIVAWSRGGPRTSGYVLRHAAKVSRVFVLAPDYNRTWSADKPRTIAPMTVQNEKGFHDMWNTGCEGHVDSGVRKIVWNERASVDPLSNAWGGIARHLPPLWYGINQELAKGVKVPFAVAVGPHDKVVQPATVKAFYEDLGSADKVFVDLACTSHFAMWEKNRDLLFNASLEWIRDGRIQGVSRGEMKLGY